MPVIEGTQIRIPTTGTRAAAIIKQMEDLLEARRTLRVSRRAFLAQWRKLRKALFLTKDYQRLRHMVHTRCRGICETCNKQPMEHMHHEQRVALAPALALDPDNVAGICRRCHRREHR